MKSADWAKKFVEAGTDEAALNAVKSEFALETRELIDARTKFSTADAKFKDKMVNTKAFATEAALREQRQKWEAIARKTSVVVASDFDSILKEHLNDVKISQETWQNKLAEANKPKQEKGKVSGRNIAKDVVIKETTDAATT